MASPTLSGVLNSEGSLRACIRSRMAPQRAEGLRVQQIAGAEGWSEHHVRWMVKRVYRKLGISGQVALVRHILAVDALPWR